MSSKQQVSFRFQRSVSKIVRILQVYKELDRTKTVFNQLVGSAGIEALWKDEYEVLRIGILNTASMALSTLENVLPPRRGIIIKYINLSYLIHLTYRISNNVENMMELLDLCYVIGKEFIEVMPQNVPIHRFIF
jgi:hypothetical protein